MQVPTNAPFCPLFMCPFFVDNSPAFKTVVHSKRKFRAKIRLKNFATNGSAVKNVAGDHLSLIFFAQPFRFRENEGVQLFAPCDEECQAVCGKKHAGNAFKGKQQFWREIVTCQKPFFWREIITRGKRFFWRENNIVSKPGLPDGLFSNQKYKFG
jgi:hypothetical protein